MHTSREHLINMEGSSGSASSAASPSINMIQQVPLHKKSPSPPLFNGSVNNLKSQMLARSAQQQSSMSSRLPPQLGQQQQLLSMQKLQQQHPPQPPQLRMNSQQQLDPSIMSRMVTASGRGGASSIPIRVASMQEFRRSMNSLNTVPELPRPNRQQMAPNQAFDLNSRRSTLTGPSNTGATRPMMGSENPLLKMMEARMAASASAQQAASGSGRNDQTPSPSGGSVASIPSVAAPAGGAASGVPSQSPSPGMNQENKAALQASISKWAGIGYAANTSSASGEKKSQPTSSAASVLGQPSIGSPSPQTGIASRQGSPNDRVPLSPKQVELLKELTASQNQSSTHPNQSQMEGAAPTQEMSRTEIMQMLLQYQPTSKGASASSSVGNSLQQPNLGNGLTINVPQSPGTMQAAAPPLPTSSSNSNSGVVGVGPQSNLARCAQSMAAIDRLRRENSSIQLRQQLALQERAYLEQKVLEKMEQEAYLKQRDIAVSTLQHQGGPSQETDKLAEFKKLSSSKLNALAIHNPNKWSSAMRKRRSLRPEDDNESICSRGSQSSTTHSMASSNTSSKIHRSLSHCSARAAITGSMENLRLGCHTTSRSMLTATSNNNASLRNASFSSGLNNISLRRNSGLSYQSSMGGGMNNQSFSSGSKSSSVGLHRRRPSAQQVTSLRRNASSSNWVKSMLSEQSTAGQAAATFEIALQHGSNASLFSLSRNNNVGQQQQTPSLSPSKEQAQEEEKDVQLVVETAKPIQVQAEEYSAPPIQRPPSTSSETVIISAVPDRIKYQYVEADTKPIDVVKEALSARGCKCDTKPSIDMPDDFFVKVTEMYDQDIVNAIRSNDVESLRKLNTEGVNLQCGNRFGETLIHLACRRSHRDLVSFLVNEAGLSLHVRDDFGRTPMHDVCWRAEPDLELLDLLLDQAPELLMLTDKRGHTPLDYSRREHWAVLVPFLLERADKFKSV